MFIEERNNTWNTPYLFNAKEYDEETGLYYYGARYYEPRISLWISTDRKQENYSNFSTYTYSINSPINYIDPDGNLVIFVNGYYNPRIGSIAGTVGGRTYWGDAFVQEAIKYFGDRRTQFVDGRGKASSSGEDRFNAGYKFAQSHYANISSTLNDGETVSVVSHSMGGAYSEGIIKYLLEQGVQVSQVVHFSPADPSDFSASCKNTFQLNLNNDFVLGIKNPLSAGGVINGVNRYGNVKTDRSFLADWFNSRVDTKSERSVWDYVRALKSIQMRYTYTKTKLILRSSTLNPTYYQVKRNYFQGSTF